MSASLTQNLSHNKYYNWLIRNLFSSWTNTILTLIALIFVYQVGSFFLNWAIFEADFRYNFQGELITDRGLCSKNIMPGEYGACWAIIYARWDQFMYGFYPVEEAWRVNLIYALLPLAIIGVLFEQAVPIHSTPSTMHPPTKTTAVVLHSLFQVARTPQRRTTIRMQPTTTARARLPRPARL